MIEVAQVFRSSRRAAYPDFPELHSAEAVDSATLLGFIAFNSEWLNHLYLLPESRFQGIGARLLALAENEEHQPDVLMEWRR